MMEGLDVLFGIYIVGYIVGYIVFIGIGGMALIGGEGDGVFCIIVVKHPGKAHSFHV